MRRKASFEDLTAILTGGLIAVLTVAFLGYIVSSDQTSRDEHREVGLREHRTLLETRSVLKKEMQPGYSVQDFLVDAVSQDNSTAAIERIRSLLQGQPDTWYWSFNGREGTVPSQANPPTPEAKPLKLPAKNGDFEVLFLRYEP